MHPDSDVSPGSSHVLNINEDGLPLLLLAAIHHPDPVLRSRLLGRLDARIAGRRPCVSGAQVRYLLHRARDRPDGGDLDPASLELAIRVVRLLFARDTPFFARKRLLLVGPEVEDDRAGLTVACEPLRLLPAEWGPRGFKKQKRPDARFRAGPAMERLARFHNRPSPFTVICRATDGFTLDIHGPTGWNRVDTYSRPLAASVLESGSSLEDLGLHAVAIPEGLRLTTPTPEAILRFSALLAREDLLRLKLGPSARYEGYLFIRLRDFDGEVSQMPSAVYPDESGKPWLSGLPPIQLEIPVADLLPIMRWAYPHEEWLTPEVRRKLVE